MSSGGNAETGRGGARTGLMILPLVIFGLLAVILYYRLYGGDPSQIPSALIGKPAPQFSLEPLGGLIDETGAAVPGFETTDLASGEVTIVNVWASWCGPCRLEHPVLVALTQSNGIPVFGINYKDNPENARRFLGQLGSPYRAVGLDPDGRASIDWGLYGVPETFIVTGDGKIAYKHVGPLTPEIATQVILPEVAKAERDGSVN